MKLLTLFLSIAYANGIFLNVNFRLTTWAEIGNVYTCEVNSIDFSSNATHVTGFNGTHLQGFTDDQVKVISFPWNRCQNFSLTRIPIGLLEFFPNIAGLNFQSCAINLLTGSELNGFKDLQMFSLTQGNIRRVPGNFFDSTPLLRFAGFSLNHIEHVGEGLFDNLQMLQQISFHNNACINRSAANRSQIPEFLEALRANCSDISTGPITTTTLYPPRCVISNLEDSVCALDDKVELLSWNDQILGDRVENLSSENENLRSRVEVLEARLASLEGTNPGNENLQNQIDELSSENENLRSDLRALLEKFEVLERNVIGLTARPCTCGF